MNKRTTAGQIVKCIKPIIFERGELLVHSITGAIIMVCTENQSGDTHVRAVCLKKGIGTYTQGMISKYPIRPFASFEGLLVIEQNITDSESTELLIGMTMKGIE
ncbi:MAG: hypothetical protein HN932_12840 [Candidatus Marinimicrobia bacterium]|jgi:hypothetical protein|nr:hypothetical protein [Candidatus Neomarinimicrobiota bacterium]MBT7339100.1 hypothetical protein [Candidatus Jacksonbacteria bacterium]